ncbi:MAG: family 2 glycosyl transferase, partial [Flavihumibacter sp. CACIAM 22H1]
MGYNAGFARANNYGIEQSKGEVLLLLNPDTLSLNNSIEECFNRLVASSYNAAGVQLINVDGSPQITGNYFILGGLNNLLPLPTIGTVIKFLAKKINVKSTSLPDSSNIVDVDWLNGAFIMVKKSIIQYAGMLDTDFFLYSEEIEWCARIRKSGPLVLYGDLKFVHLQGATANEVFNSSGKGYYNLYDKKGCQILVSNFLRIRKQYGAIWFVIHLFIYILEVPILMFRYFFGRLSSTNEITKSMAFGFPKNLLKLICLA